MQAITVGNGVKVYNLSKGKTLPDWLNSKQKKSLKKDEEFRRRIELIQDFGFPVNSSKTVVTKDGNFAISAGTYPPAVKIYELGQLSLKCERRVESEVTQITSLSDNYAKFALLHGAARTVEFHAQFGAYFKTRVPRAARDMVYNPRNCDLCVCGSSNEVWRLNLEQGRFLAPLASDTADSFNVCDVNPAHGLLAFGGDAGTVECFDPRTRERAAVLDVAAAVPRWELSVDDEGVTVGDVGVSALRFCGDGLTMGVGTTTGHCLLYDLRSAAPYVTKYHQNATPIVSVRFHDGAGGADSRARVLSADRSAVKAWDKSSGANLFAIEPGAGNITDVTPVGEGTGMLFLSGEFRRIQVIYVPTLGPAPKWCSFLDNLTEELEESAPNIYADFKFVTKQELAQLGLDRLVGTNYLRAYMHGYFVDMRMYKKVKELVDPFAYDKYRSDVIKRKVEEKSNTRIFARSKLPKVNADLAKDLMAIEESANNTSTTTTTTTTTTTATTINKKAARAVNILKDDRFAEMFTNEDFAYNAEQAREAGSQKSRARIRAAAAAEAAAAAGRGGARKGTEDEHDDDDYDDEIASDEDDTAAGKRAREEEYIEEHFARVRDSDNEDDNDSDEGMYELKAGENLSAAMESVMPGARAAEKRRQFMEAKRARLANESMPLAGRVKLQEDRAAAAASASRSHGGGSGREGGPEILGMGRGLESGVREMTFIPQKEVRQEKRKNQAKVEALERERRSVAARKRSGRKNK